MSIVRISHLTSSAKHISPVAGGTIADLQVTANSAAAKRHTNERMVEIINLKTHGDNRNHEKKKGSWDEGQESRRKTLKLVQRICLQPQLRVKPCTIAAR
jgi:hypothetical protein